MQPCKLRGILRRLITVTDSLTVTCLYRMSGDEGNFWAPDYSTGSWRITKEVVQPLIKVEVI
jgi:hypothetical protein